MKFEGSVDLCGTGEILDGTMLDGHVLVPVKLRGSNVRTSLTPNEHWVNTISLFSS